MTTVLIIIFIFILVLVIWAFFSKGEEKIKIPDEKEEKIEEKTLRRRAEDKAIEKESQDSGVNLFRRKDDIESIEDFNKVEEDFKLPYSADEIIPEGSRYWIYNRTLLNSEIYATKGDFPTAIALYRGVYERVIDQEVNVKIKANVDYLQEYQKLHVQRKTEALRQKALSKRGTEIKLSIDGPLTIPDKIQIALAPHTHKEEDMVSKFDVNKIVDNIVDKITEKQSKFSDTGDKENEITQLKENIDKLTESQLYKDKSKIESIESQIKDLNEKNNELSRLKEGLLNLHAKIIDLQNESIDNLKAPSIAEAKFQVSPDKIIQDKIPATEAPSSKRVEFQKEIQKEKEEPEEIELLGQNGKEANLEELSDEDIFEKILKDDLKKKKDESFEILGYNKEEKDDTYDVIDKEQEEKQIEEGKFYRKFLRHGRRIKKELPILRVSYDFSKLPDEFSLSKDQNILQYSFYKYKPMLEKANELIKRRNVRDAINYYNVVKDQNIPPEFKVMLDKNINELREYVEKYLSTD